MINKDTYKRLTERRGSLVIDKCGNCPNVNNPQGCTDKKCYEIMKNRLAELEDKIENGTLKEIDDSLIGKKVFVIEINTVERRIRLSSSPWKILGFTKNGIIASHIYRLGCYEYYDDDFWFFDYDEAEAKFKELQEGKEC